MSLLRDFKKFVLRGNVVDLAVAIVVGTAFTAVVKALVVRHRRLRQPTSPSSRSTTATSSTATSSTRFLRS